MKEKKNIIFVTILIISLTAISTFASTSSSTLGNSASAADNIGFRYPAISPDGSEIAFSYKGDIWVANIDGSGAHPITFHVADDIYPKWSKNGQWIAFSSNRYGNFDVFVIPSKGGQAKRLTYLSTDDLVDDFNSEGWIVFESLWRQNISRNLYQIYYQGGNARQITKSLERTIQGSYSSDGSKLAYVRGGYHWTRRGFQGENNSEIWIRPINEPEQSFKFTNNNVHEFFPMWLNDNQTLYYLSEASGCYNLWKQKLADQPLQITSLTGNLWKQKIASQPQQVTFLTGDGIKTPNISADGSKIVYESEFKLFWLDTQTEKIHAIPLDLNAEDKFNLVYTEELKNGATTASGGVKSFHLSKDNEKIALEIERDIFSIGCGTTAEDKDQETEIVVNDPFTQLQPRFSPDGHKIAFISDQSHAVLPHENSPQIFIKDLEQQDSPIKITNFEGQPRQFEWSPNGKYLVVVVGISELWLIELENKNSRKLASAGWIEDPSWSPDSVWVAFEEYKSKYLNIAVVNIQSDKTALKGKVSLITDDYHFNIYPFFSEDGKYLVYTSYYGDAYYNSDIIKVPLTRKKEKAAAPQVNNEKQKAAEKSKKEEAVAPQATKETQKEEKAPPRVEIDFEGICDRGERITPTSGKQEYGKISPDGKYLAYLEHGEEPESWAAEPTTDLFVIELEDGFPQRLTDGETIKEYYWTKDSQEIYFRSNDTIKKVSNSVDSSAQPVVFSVNAEIQQLALVRQKYDQVFRDLKDYYADANFHGVDLKWLYEKYYPLLPFSLSTQSFNLLIDQVFGELDSSHLYIFDGPPPPTENETCGDLGLIFDFEASPEGALKISGIIPKSPVDTTELDQIQVGEFLLEIDGNKVGKNINFYQFLINKVDKEVKLLVNKEPTVKNARTVVVKPISNSELISDKLYNSIVEEKRQLVHQESHDKVGYLHIDAMSEPAYEKFRVDFSREVKNKDSLIIDIRNNGGGSTHERILDILARKQMAWSQNRNSPRQAEPLEMFAGKIILLINGQAGSDAEIFPYGFEEYKLGKVVGTPTAGAVIGICQLGELSDGTKYAIPCNSWFKMDGTNLEEYCVKPDVLVENSEADYVNGYDRQLYKAIEIALEK